MNWELLRQGIHIVGGAFFAALFIFMPKESALISIAGIFFIGAMIALWHRIYGPLPIVQEILQKVEREDEKGIPGKAGLVFAIAALLTAIIFFGFDGKIIAGGILVLSFGDGFSTLAGKKFGKVKIAGEKTIEGTAAGILAAWIALAPLFPLQTALAGAVAGMLAEHLPVNDNFSIPIAAAAALAFLA